MFVIGFILIGIGAFLQTSIGSLMVLAGLFIMLADKNKIKITEEN